MYSQPQEGPEPAMPAVAPSDDVPALAVVRRPTSLASFKSEIARAMQVAADRERARIEAGVGEEESAQVEKIYARAAAEAAELSKHADEDVNLVNVWFEDQVRRIRQEADRQIADRHVGLEQALTQHGSLIEAEMESVHVAVQGYQSVLGEYFGHLAEEQEPGAIARLAGLLPDPPDLDEVRADARASAMTTLEPGPATDTSDRTDGDAPDSDGGAGTGSERELVPVMDPDAGKVPTGVLVNAVVLATTPAASEAVVSTTSADDAPAGDELEPVAVAAGAAADSASTGSVASRVLRALTSWTSAAPTGGPQEH